MMVTFVSECEKKALSRTRRVLDAFANRIGNRTWQTVITNEGLQAVKKLLRKTATKNTAVSCHWIRSRSRSELQWVVGDQSKFNNQGIVPVNYTNQINALKMDELNVNIENYYANTKKQPLAQHLFAVGYVAYRLCLQLTENEQLAKTAYVAGCWHDMGKVDFVFSDWLLKELKKKGILDTDVPETGQHDDKKAKNYPRHNEISLLLFYLLNKQNFPNSQSKKTTENAIYWHHDKWFRGVEKDGSYTGFSLDMVHNKIIEKIGADKFKTMLGITRALTQQINGFLESYSEDTEDESLVIDNAKSSIDQEKIHAIEDEPLPDYKKYKPKLRIDAYHENIQFNALNNIARTVVITADRLVSSLSADDLNSHLEERTLHELAERSLLNDRGLTNAIKLCLDQFNDKYPESDRNKQQKHAALELADDEINIGVLNGPAGCGKTKIALEWALNTHARKIIWICPRVQVCQGLVNDLTSLDYLPDTKIEIVTGEFKTLYQHGKTEPTSEGKEFSGDIVITTIDQILNTITTHNKITGLVQYMNAHVVFDEYHEYITMPGFNLLFAELVACKKLQPHTNNTLLVSATPNPYFIKELLNLNPNDIIGIESFNQSPYKIEFVPFDEGDLTNNPMSETQPENTFVISNTAITAQRSFIKNQSQENALLFHSKFKKDDKAELFNKVFESFKYQGKKDYAILRAGPIVQASLNITCDKMLTEITHAENWLQRLGRLDRFAQNSQPNVYITVIPKTLANGKEHGACARFLSKSNSLQSTKAWYFFMLDKITDNPVLSIANIYQLYQEFYADSSAQQAIEQDLLKSLETSVKTINLKIMDPVSFPNKNKAKKEDQPKIKKHSLRGDNRFVQMAVWNIDNDKEEFPNEYAYDEGDTEGQLTLEVDRICGNGVTGKDLLDFMAKKHHNIKEGTKKAYKNNLLLGEARSPESPIYLSYIPDDLKKVETQPHRYAIYYAIGKKQIIGTLSRDQIQSDDEELQCD